MDLTKITKHLSRSESGIWTPQDAAAVTLSFPEGGHGDCFEIEDRSFWFAHRNECISLALKRYPFDGPFLDVGGGNGAVSKRLEADGIATVMMEPGPEGAANARARGLSTVVCATLEQAAFSAGAFGGAGLFDVIEHVDDDEAILRGVRDVLRRGGVLAVTVPAYDWLWSAEDVRAGHHRRYTRRRLRAVLARSGFDVRYDTYFFAPLTMPLFLGRSLRYRLPGGKRVQDDLAEVSAAQHSPGGAAQRVMDSLLAPEVKMIAGGSAIPFGTSCLAIALAK